MARLALAAAFLAATASAVPSPKSLKSDVTLLVPNDLEGQDSPIADDGVLYLSRRQSFREARESCKALGEELWEPSHYNSDTGDTLDRIDGDGDAQFWVASDGDKQRTMSKAGHVYGGHGGLELPVLCTQTAPWSNSSFVDTDKQWRVQIHSNNEELVGYRDHQTFRFLGVRYAPQPERFTYSKPYHGSGGITSALEYGSECTQIGVGTEDCLFMNIFTPYLPSCGSSPKKLRPVLFWMHGGAFENGSGNDPTFDGANIVSRGDVVLVAINYRVSTLGYLALDDGVTNGNFGLADQILALDWVRDNIRDFGGDPERITIFGQSAGAGSVRAMMASPKAVGKFSAAIPMSNLGGLAFGATYSKYYTIKEDVQVAGKAILAATNCTDAVSQVDCLRKVNATTLVNLPVTAAFLVVDGTYLTTDQLQLEGPRAPYKLMMGIAAQDGTPFITYPRDIGPKNKSWITTQGLPYPPRSLFPLPDLKNKTLAVDRMAARLATDAEFRCIDQATVYAGLHNGLFDKVYYYEYQRSYQTPSWPLLDLCEPPKSPVHPYGNPEAKIGYLNCHSGELLYVFGNIRRMGLPYRDQEGDKLFERELLDRWAAFAWGKDPNIKATSGTIKKWEPAVKDKLNLMVLDWPNEYLGKFHELEQCKWLGFPLDYYL